MSLKVGGKNIYEFAFWYKTEDDKILNEDMILQLLDENIISKYITTRNNIKSKELLSHKNCISFPYQGWFTNESLEELENVWIKNINEAIKKNYINLVPVS